ncbi:MAG TPA: hypothetical protein DDW84_06065 [Phycisphaerales bacterium]|nr:hypothetical protein [Phycisphaerales bacterium]
MKKNILTMICLLSVAVFAYNNVQASFVIRNDANKIMAKFDSQGNLTAEGNFTQNNTTWPANFEGFKLYDPNESVIAAIESDTGNVKIAGQFYTNQLSLTPSNELFVIKDSNGSTVAYFDKWGDLYLKGDYGHTDTDGDGIPDVNEIDYGLDPNDYNDADLNLDGDGQYNNLCEYLHSSNPNDINDAPSGNITICVPHKVDKIQRAIDASIDGDTIVVSEGTYYENIDFDSKAITLKSIDSNDPNVVAATIIDANNTSLDVVAFNNGEDANSILDGLTIRGGQYGVKCSGASPLIKNCRIMMNNLDGVYVTGNSSRPNIVNCNIVNNSGNGVYLYYNKPSSNLPKVIDCNISNNTSCGIRSEGSIFLIANCTIINNSSDGIWFRDESTSTITDCNIENNNQAGISCSGSSPLIQGCRIIGCRYGITSDNYSGWKTFYSRPVIRNCVVAKSTYSGMSINPQVAEVNNCTIYGNTQYGLYCSSNYSNVKNCIIWDNYSSLEGHNLYNCSATYSCIEDVVSGNGNIYTDPMFVNSDSNDFHLWYSSPCIDAGDPCSSYSNEPNGGGGRIDMGAYGNTDEAATSLDADGDGIADGWEHLYWPNDDPNQHNANENLDGDKFNNLVEYMFRYNPTEDTNVPIAVSRMFLSTNKFDPTKNETVTVKYMLNMNANVVINFTDSGDPNNVTKTIQHSAAAGVIQTAIWDGKDLDGLIFEKKYYDVSISADDGDGNAATYDPGTVQLDYDYGITDLVCNPRRVIATYNEFSTISYNIACDSNVIVSIYDSCGVLFSTLLNNASQQQSQNPQQVIWSPRQGEPNDPNSKYISKEGFYEIEVKFPGMREKAIHKLGVYR